MINVYDWDSNRINLSDKINNQFDLQLRGRLTIVYGFSASGKTLLCSKIKDIQDDMNVGIRTYIADNVVLIDRKKDIDNIYKNKNKLIIIDRADMILDDKAVEYINYEDKYNRYLIMLRKPVGIEATPNHFGEFVNENGVIQMNYRYNVGGWC